MKGKPRISSQYAHLMLLLVVMCCGLICLPPSPHRSPHQPPPPHSSPPTPPNPAPPIPPPPSCHLHPISFKAAGCLVLVTRRFKHSFRFNPPDVQRRRDSQCNTHAQPHPLPDCIPHRLIHFLAFKHGVEHANVFPLGDKQRSPQNPISNQLEIP